ncbi:hypothetical protein V8B97DRAFT_1876519 [Scleroderma yunnanense]
MKKQKTASTVKQSYIEVAGKTALLLYTQDGRHSAPSLQILGNHIILMFFDRGGSLLTVPIDINKYPEEFLHALIGILQVPLTHIGFDETVLWDRDRRKCIVVVLGDQVGTEVVLDRLIFISDALHGHGTMVWAAKLMSALSGSAPIS